MNEAAFVHLQLPDTQELIERNLNIDSAIVALRTADRVVAEQVKYLGRAKTKLPSWYSARCVIDERLFEQSSSQVASEAKFEEFDGQLALDLTCGLGVDSAALSSKFERVISIEIDQLKADIARYNFDRLGIHNVEIRTDSAENFCKQAVDAASHFDLIFIDPSRVNEKGEKVYSLEQSSPNVLEIMPLLRKLSDKIMIKLSPLFDIDECFRLFDDVKTIDIVSVNGECKEVNVLIDALHRSNQSIINHTVIRSNCIQRYPIISSNNVSKMDIAGFEKRYLYEADVAFYKSRCVDRYVEQSFEKQDFIFDNYIFTSLPMADFAGAGYIIECCLPYNTRKIKMLMNQLTIKTATLHLRDFPIAQSELYKTLKIREGASAHFFFTRTGGVPTCYYVKPLKNR